MCCTGCPSECAGTFTKSCCLQKWSLDACMRFGFCFVFLWLCFKASHSFLCNLNSVFTACPNVISLWVNVSKARLVHAALLSPGAWLTVPASIGDRGLCSWCSKPHVGPCWYTAWGCQNFENNSTEMCYLRLWDSLLQNVTEIKNLASFKFGCSITQKQDCWEVNNQKNIWKGCKVPSLEDFNQSLWAGRTSLRRTVYPARSFLRMLLNHHFQSQPMDST